MLINILYPLYLTDICCFKQIILTKEYKLNHIDDCYMDCYEIHQLCIILNEYLENYIDETVIADRASTFVKIIKNKIETLSNDLDKLSENEIKNTIA